MLTTMTFLISGPVPGTVASIQQNLAPRGVVAIGGFLFAQTEAAHAQWRGRKNHFCLGAFMGGGRQFVPTAAVGARPAPPNPFHISSLLGEIAPG